MLEQNTDGPLLTWRLPRWPVSPGDIFTPLMRHRRIYLEIVVKLLVLKRDGMNACLQRTAAVPFVCFHRVSF